MRFLSIIVCFITCSLNLGAQNNILSPEQFLGSYGKQYSFEYRLNQYYDYLTESSPKIKKIFYGNSWENRPLQLLFISSPENLNDLESLNKSHLYSLGFSKERSFSSDNKTFVWLSFGVHGNEAGASESVPSIIYHIISNSEKNYDAWLKDVVVIIDPNLNPDGNSRYTHWINQVSGVKPHPELYDREHFEPWPRGRYNHYLFDLNRDWAWQTQKETSQRMHVYNQWLPHIHADFHEMGYEANYYFAPAAEPFHKYVSDFQKSFQTEIGKNHARYFDEKGKLYWTRERFDLFYPSYGDTYPTFNGAVGMTYEQAGHSLSGRAIILSNGDTLTLAQKIENNTIIALSTIEIAVKNSDPLRKNLIEYFNQSRNNPIGKFKSYILKKSKSIEHLLGLFDKSQIEYAFAAEKQKINAYHYQSKQNRTLEIEEGDIIITANQNKSVLLQVLMEEVPELADSLTYDITAWALPLAYNIDCYALSNPINIKLSNTFKKEDKVDSGTKAYAYVLPWQDVKAAKILSSVLQNGFRARMAKKPVQFSDIKIQRGDIVISRGDNSKFINFDDDLKKLDSEGEYLRPLLSGYSLNGGDLGGEAFELISKPKVLLFSGEGTDATAVGEVWYYFEQVLNYPVSILGMEQFSRIDFSKYNTVILPGGWYSLSQDQLKDMEAWVQHGGRLIAIENAAKVLEAKEGFGLELFATEEEKSNAEKKSEDENLKARTYEYESFERRFLSSGTAGAIVKNTVDETHPLGFGLGKYYYSLKTNSMVYRLQKGFQNIISVPEKYDSYGFVGHKLKGNLPNSVTLAAKHHGKGEVICFVDNPLFRGFWYRGVQLFGNAVFFPF